MVAKKPTKKVEPSCSNKAEAVGSDTKKQQGKQPASTKLFQAAQLRMLNKAILRLALANQSALVAMEPGLKPWLPKARLSDCTRRFMRSAPEGQEAAKEIGEENAQDKKSGGKSGRSGASNEDDGGQSD